jgi:hypothetical protein
MAVIPIGRLADSISGEPLQFTGVWDHYLRSGLIYPTKLERLQAALGSIQRDWSKLVSAPADIFQFHFATHGAGIARSVCAFRDTDETYVAQHAASTGGSHGVEECVKSHVRMAGEDGGAGFLSMYYRPENRWPARMAESLNGAHPSRLTASTTQAYLVRQFTRSHARSPMEWRSEEAAGLTDDEVVRLAIAAIGPLRVAALGIGEHSLGLAGLRARYEQAGLHRSRRVLGAWRDGALAGIALCHASGVPMNFSYLCRRVEILVHPEAPDRGSIVRELARASIGLVEGRGDPVCVLLIHESDAEDAVAGGFEATGRRYSRTIWARENEAGWPSIWHELERIYDIRARVARGRS